MHPSLLYCRNYQGADATAAICIAIFTIGTMWPMSTYTGESSGGFPMFVDSASRRNHSHVSLIYDTISY